MLFRIGKDEWNREKILEIGLNMYENVKYGRIGIPI